MKKLYMLSVCFILLLGCDIPGKIIVENRTNELAVFRCVFTTKDSVKEIRILPDKDKNTAGLLFGFGHRWSDNVINNYVSNIDTINIFSTYDTLVMVDKKIMFDFFRSRRRGIFKDEIKIVVK